MIAQSLPRELIKKHGLISEQMDKRRLAIILDQLNNVIDRNVEGDIVEFGCYVGTTSVFIRRLLNLTGSPKQFHVYDSFAGLPPKSIKDASLTGSDFKSGELKASKRSLVRNFKKSSLQLPLIHKAWFNELKNREVPSSIAFAFIDGDFYDSITDSLNLVWPRLSVNGVIVVDDFMRSSLPGVTRAIKDFFNQEEISLKHQEDMAIINKSV